MRSGASLFGLLALVAGFVRSGSASAERVRPALVWYRSADGCPDGAAFLARLEARGVRAKLADVGDPIDFVVTLGNGPEGARGLLERQTDTRSVAVRRLDGGTCEQVADAIALSLVVANTARDEPDGAPQGPAETPPDMRSPYEVSRPAHGDAPPFVRRGKGPAFSLGFQGGALVDVAPSPLLAGSIFVELELRTAGALEVSTLRVAALGARGSSSSPRSFDLFVAGGRLEACLFRFGTEVIHATPCAAVTLANIHTHGEGPAGHSDDGLWSTVDLGGRFAWRLATPISLELQAGAVIPLERYDFVSDAAHDMYRAPSVGAGVALGAAVRLP